MDTKHNDDTLKTMKKKREPLKERDGQPPSTPQPKKQWISLRIYEDHTTAGRPKKYTLWVDDLELETAANLLLDKIKARSQ